MADSIFEPVVQSELERRGWTVFHRGFPDFICFKDGAIKFVEVKRGRDKLKPTQRKVIEGLKRAGFEVETVKQGTIPISRGGASIGISDATKKTFDELKDKVERRLASESSGVRVVMSSDEFLNVLLVTYKSSILSVEASAK